MEIWRSLALNYYLVLDRPSVEPRSISHLKNILSPPYWFFHEQAPLCVCEAFSCTVQPTACAALGLTQTYTHMCIIPHTYLFIYEFLQTPIGVSGCKIYVSAYLAALALTHILSHTLKRSFITHTNQYILACCWGLLPFHLSSVSIPPHLFLHSSTFHQSSFLFLTSFLCLHTWLHPFIHQSCAVIHHLLSLPPTLQPSLYPHDCFGCWHPFDLERGER